MTRAALIVAVALFATAAPAAVRVVSEADSRGPTVLVIDDGDEGVAVALGQAGAWPLAGGRLVTAGLREAAAAVRDERPAAVLVLSVRGLNPIPHAKGRPAYPPTPPVVLTRKVDGRPIAADLNAANDPGAEPFGSAPAVGGMVTAVDAAAADQDPRHVDWRLAASPEAMAAIPADTPVVRVVLALKADGLTSTPATHYRLFRQAIFDVLRAQGLLGGRATPWTLIGPRRGRLTVAVYQAGSAFVGRSNFGSAGPREYPDLMGDARPDVAFTFVGPAELTRPQTLAEFDAVLITGGFLGGGCRELGPAAVHAVREFVRQGGGYVGTGGGAALAGTAYPWTAHLINARTRSTGDFTRPIATVGLGWTVPGQNLLGVPPGPTVVHYAGGPLIDRGTDPTLPPYTTLATYEPAAVVEPPARLSAGMTAVVAGALGKGRVVCFGPDPETNDSAAGADLVRRALRWSTGRRSTPQF